MPYMKLITLKLSERWIQDLDELVGRKLYANRAEAIRAAIRDMRYAICYMRYAICDMPYAAIRDLLAKEIWPERRP